MGASADSDRVSLARTDGGLNLVLNLDAVDVPDAVAHSCVF